MGSRDSGPGPPPHTSLPAPAPSASSSSGWCAEKNITGLLKRLKRACASPRGVLARGRCDGNGTQRGGAAPAHALQEHVPGRLEELLAFQRCAGFVKREEFILSSCQSVTSRRLSAFLPSTSAPTSLPLLPDVRSAGGCKIPCAQAGESQHLPNLTRGIRASPKPHQADPKMRIVLSAGAEHFNFWCCFNPGFQFGAICHFHAVGLRALL